MTPEPQEIGSGKDLATRSPEVDFAVVLSRVIGSIEDDPAQLRNAVYELARIKLRREAWRRNPAISVREARRRTLALEPAIDRVETIYSKHDELRALQSLYRLIESSEIGRSEVLIEPPEPLLIVSQAPAQTTDAEPVFLTRAKGASLKVERSLHWAGAAPILRGALVVIFSVALCVVLSQFGLLGTQAPQKATVEKNASPEPKPVVQGRGQALQSPATPLPQSSPFPLPTVYGVYAVSGGELHELEALPGRV